MFKKNNMLYPEEIDNLVCLFDLEKQVSYDLDQVGSDIWNLARDNFSIDDILDTLIDRYDVDMKTLRADVEKFINYSVELGIFIKST